MGLASWLFGSDVSKAIDAVGNVIDKVFTSDEERENARYLMERLKQEPHILQLEINKQEARHRSIFVAGWRPFIGWVCGLGFANAFLLTPFLVALGVPPIHIPLEHMMTLVLSLLGLGGMRTFEKLKGVESNNMKDKKL